MKEVRPQLHALCAISLREKIAEVNKAMALQQEASAGDTKSSAGDKFETGTAMTHLELQKLGKQLQGLETTLRRLNAFAKAKTSATVQAGSLIKTQRNFFWISIGVGPVKLGETHYYVISPLAPIAQRLLGKKAGFTFIFNQQEDCILEVI